MLYTGTCVSISWITSSKHMITLFYLHTHIYIYIYKYI